MTEVVTKDEFGAELEAQGEALAERQRQLDAEREEWRGLVLGYVKFMRARGKSVPAFALEVEKPPAPPEPEYDPAKVRLVRVAGPRVGPKRRIVLDYIAKATREGRVVTSREILKHTGFPLPLVANVMWQDYKAGYLERVNAIESTGPNKTYEVRMSPKGMEFLAKVESGDKESPRRRPAKTPTDPGLDL